MHTGWHISEFSDNNFCLSCKDVLDLLYNNMRHDNLKIVGYIEYALKSGLGYLYREQQRNNSTAYVQKRGNRLSIQLHIIISRELAIHISNMLLNPAIRLLTNRSNSHDCPGL